MFAFAFALVTLLVLYASPSDGRINKHGIDSSSRKLGYLFEYTCEDYIDDNNLCCGEDLSHCNWIFRDLHIFQGIWDHYCADIAAYTEECKADENNEEETLPNIVEAAISQGSFSTLVTAVTAADLANTLASSDEEFTVFAPTDIAFSSLPDGLVDCLLKDENKEVLTAILLYHVVDGAAASSGLSDGQEIVTLNGESVVVDITGGVVKINDSVVSIPDLMTSNGIIHVIDSVLVPPGVDVAAFLGTCSAEEDNDTEETLPNIVEAAISQGSFSTLVAAVTAADLANTLASSDEEFTVFAPTDIAFSSLPDGLVDCLLKDENKEVLTAILLYHVVDGAAASSSLSDGQEIVTSNGESMVVDITSGVVKISDSVVSIPDLMTSNGIIHVIDSVLVPPDVDVAAFLETC